LLPSFNAATGLSWADPLIGVRYHRDLGNGFSATASGDIGGFGAGAHLDWQLLDTIDYALNSWIELHGGLPRGRPSAAEWAEQSPRRASESRHFEEKR